MSRLTTGLERWGARIILFCTIGTCFSVAGIVYLQLRANGLASAGKAARERQQAVYPVSLKLYEDANARHVISAAELVCFRDSRRCPPPRPRP